MSPEPKLDAVTRNMGEYIFNSSYFSGLNLEGGSLDSVMIFCEITDCDFYWTNAIGGLFVKSSFVGVTFRGVPFAGARFLECKFSNCRFLKDNLGGDCGFEDALFVRCTFQDTSGVPAPNRLD
jgi:uncharacterized protein YjbI with pentapeptide repeats